jgi:hypothetical protein
MTLPDHITPSLEAILGRPNFACCHLAARLRELGHDIPKKAEAEQAHVLFYCLGLYAAHGDDWASVAVERLRRPDAALT